MTKLCTQQLISQQEAAKHLCGSTISQDLKVIWPTYHTISNVITSCKLECVDHDWSKQSKFLN